MAPFSSILNTQKCRKNTLFKIKCPESEKRLQN